MNIKQHSITKIGYFSQSYGEYCEPQWKILNLKKLKEINQERRPLNCSKDSNWEDVSSANTIEYLIQFLINRDLISLDETPRDANVFNAICESDILFEMLIRDQLIPEIEKKFRFYQRFNENNYVIEGNSRNSKSKDSCSTETRALRSHLTKHANPDECEAKVYLVTRHQYEFTNNQTVNLYISKEINAVHHVNIADGFEETKDLIPLVLTAQPYYKFATPAMLRKFNNKLIFSDYLAGGLTFLLGVMPNVRKEVQKVTILEEIDTLCQLEALTEFQRRLADFLYSIAESNIIEGELVKSEGLEFISNKQNPNSKKYWIPVTSLYEWETIPHIQYEPEPHKIAVLGNKSVQVPKDLYFYRTDIISIENYRNNTYEHIISNGNYVYIGKDYDERKEVEERKRC